jgi:hypothetical protein
MKIFLHRCPETFSLTANCVKYRVNTALYGFLDIVQNIDSSFVPITESLLSLVNPLYALFSDGLLGCLHVIGECEKLLIG